MTKGIASRIFDTVFGCHHRELSRVFTIDRQTYKVCCACGARFKYSLETMSMDRRGAAQSTPALAALRIA